MSTFTFIIVCILIPGLLAGILGPIFGKPIQRLLERWFGKLS